MLSTGLPSTLSVRYWNDVKCPALARSICFSYMGLQFLLTAYSRFWFILSMGFRDSFFAPEPALRPPHCLGSFSFSISLWEKEFSMFLERRWRSVLYSPPPLTLKDTLYPYFLISSYLLYSIWTTWYRTGLFVLFFYQNGRIHIPIVDFLYCSILFLFFRIYHTIT